MPNLATCLNEMEEDIKKIIQSAWSTSGFGPIKKIFTDTPEEQTTARDLPQAALVMPAVDVADDEYGSLCSESGVIEASIYLHAMKPKGVSLMAEKRQRAQQLRTAIKAGAADIRHAELLLWMGDAYQEQEDFTLAAVGDAYVIRVKYRITLSWSEE